MLYLLAEDRRDPGRDLRPLPRGRRLHLELGVRERDRGERKYNHEDCAKVDTVLARLVGTPRDFRVRNSG